MRKTIAGIALGASIIGGGAASATIFAPTFAGAQAADDTAPADDSATDETTRPERQTLADVIAPLVDDGTITQAQADAVIEALQEARPEGRRGHRGHRGFGGREAVVEALGITAEELRAALVDGSTIADVAAANGVDVQDVVDAIVAAGQAKLDAAVDAGRMTAEEAAEKAAELEERATAIVNGEVDVERGPRGPRGGEATDDTTDA